MVTSSLEDLVFDTEFRESKPDLIYQLGMGKIDVVILNLANMRKKRLMALMNFIGLQCRHLESGKRIIIYQWVPFEEFNIGVEGLAEAITTDEKKQRNIIQFLAQAANLGEARKALIEALNFRKSKIAETN